MTKKKSKLRKTKTKIVYRYKKPIEDTSKKYKEEIKELEEKKSQLKQKVEQAKENKGRFGRLLIGIKGGLVAGNINKEISMKKRLAIQPEQIQGIKRQIELEKAREELAKIRKRRSQSISFESLGGNEKTRSINFKDLL